MIYGKQLRAEATELRDIGEVTRRRLEAAGLDTRELMAALRALYDPHMRAAEALEKAADKLDALPPLGLGSMETKS